MRRLAQALLILLMVLIAWASFQSLRNWYDAKRSNHVVKSLGGRMGSLPVLWGAEYVISFRELELSKDDLGRLTVLNSLAERNPVYVGFVDTNLTESDRPGLRALLPRCAIHIEGAASQFAPSP